MYMAVLQKGKRVGSLLLTTGVVHTSYILHKYSHTDTHANRSYDSVYHLLSVRIFGLLYHKVTVTSFIQKSLQSVCVSKWYVLYISAI